MSVKLAIPMIWCLAAAVLLRLMSAWDSLPDRVAVHFGLKMQPNGWSSKRTLVALVVVAVVGHAALATWLLLHIGFLGPMFPLTQAVTSVVLVCSFWQVINYNAEGTPFRASWVLGPVVLLLVLAGAFALNLTSQVHGR